MIVDLAGSMIKSLGATYYFGTCAWRPRLVYIIYAPVRTTIIIIIIIVVTCYYVFYVTHAYLYTFTITLLYIRSCRVHRACNKCTMRVSYIYTISAYGVQRSNAGNTEYLNYNMYWSNMNYPRDNLIVSLINEPRVRTRRGGRFDLQPTVGRRNISYNIHICVRVYACICVCACACVCIQMCSGLHAF